VAITRPVEPRRRGASDLLRSFLRDSSHALRQFRRAKLFASGIILSLGFGIGASAAVYSWMQAALLRPLPVVPRFDELVTTRPDSAHGWNISLDEYREWRDNARSVAGLAAAHFTLFAIQPDESRSGATSLPVYGMYVSSNYFDVLQIRPGTGRFFLASDDVPESPLVAVISHALGERLFASRVDVVGRMIRVNNQLIRVIGVAPPRFGGNLAIARFDFWVPLHARPHLEPSQASLWTRRDVRWLDGIGRLAPGATVTQADAELRAIAARQAATFVENEGRSASVVPLDVGSADQLKPLFAALIAVTVLVVLLICSNVANLLLTRAATRQRELGIRLSVGAARRRIVRQLMTESLVLAVIGGALGAVVGLASEILISTFIPTSSITLRIETTLDLPFLGFVALITTACVLVFGLAPAWFGSRVDLMSLMKSGADNPGRSVGFLRRALVGTQFAFALAILVCMSLIVRWDQDVSAIDVGFRDSDQVLLLQTDMSLAGYGDLHRWRRTLDEATERVRQVPGVTGAALGAFVPLGLFGYNRQPFEVPGYPMNPDAPERVLANTVGPEYFETMGVEIVVGRGITSQDTPESVPVAVVNQAFARRYFGSESPIGRTFRLRGVELQVAGVAKNGRYDYREIDDPEMPFVYTSWAQMPAGVVSMHVRTSGDPMALATAARRAIAEVDPSIPFLPSTTLREYSGIAFAVTRSAAKILRWLGTVAIILATMGLFTIVSYGVTLRTREIGIRLAIGASRPLIVRQVVRSALGMTLIGALAGMVTATALVILVRSQLPLLPEISARDFVLPALLLTLCAIAAALSPAHRAASIDPARTLRSE
jgi:predicted permease